MTEQNWNAWIGRSQTTQDIAALSPVQRLAATLNRDWDSFCSENAVPPLAHWLYFLPCEAQSQLGMDGHAKKGSEGGLLPPVDLPRRMWAGSQLQFHREIPLGSAIERTSRIASINTKQGKTGALVFVRVAHEVKCSGELAISEFHDIVYRIHRRAVCKADSARCHAIVPLFSLDV
jgi:3-methylfumaryl-CoA hydratase